MLVKVAVGIILHNDSVFLALRKAGQHQGGMWEFPGGKCEASESAETALVRELEEECGILVKACSFFKVVYHDYGDKKVELCFYKVIEFEGEPIGKEGQEVRWVAISDLLKYQFPDANLQIVNELVSSSK